MASKQFRGRHEMGDEEGDLHMGNMQFDKNSDAETLTERRYDASDVITLKTRKK